MNLSTKTDNFETAPFYILRKSTVTTLQTSALSQDLGSKLNMGFLRICRVLSAWSLKQSGAPIQRYAKEAAKLYCYIEKWLYRNPRYYEMAVK